MIYLYAITGRAAPLPPLQGVRGGAPFALPHGDLVAIVSALAETKLAPTPEHLWQHEAVVETLMHDRTVLPARFGTLLADEDALRAALHTHAAALHADLARVAGRVELGVRVLAADRPTTNDRPTDDRPTTNDDQSPMTNDQLPTPVAVAGGGHSYMLARLAEEQRTQAQRQHLGALAAALHAALAQGAAESVARTLLTEQMLLAGSYLVERTAVATFRQRVADLGAAHPALRILHTGPWPPYHFVTAGIAAERAQSLIVEVAHGLA